MKGFLEAALGLLVCFTTAIVLIAWPKYALFVGLVYLFIGVSALGIYAFLGMWKEEHATYQATEEQSGQAVLGMGQEGRQV